MRSIKLKALTNQEIGEFPLTKAGVYSMVKFVCENCIPQSRKASVIVDLNWYWREQGGCEGEYPKIAELYSAASPFLEVVSSVSNIGYVAKRNINFVRDFIRNKYNSIWQNHPYINMWYDSDAIVNIKNTPFGNFLLEDLFELNGRLYPRKFQQFVRRCENCGELYLSQEAMDDFGLSIGDFARIDSNDIGYEDCCHDCVDDVYDGMRQCDYSGRWEREDDLYYVENTDQYVCEEYRDWGCFYTCEECGALIDTDEDNDSISTDDDCFFCCYDCAERAGYHYSENRECWTQDEEEEEDVCDDADNWIVGYHHYHFNKIILVDKRRKQDLLVGMELEIDGKNRYDFYDDFYSALFNLYKNNNGDSTTIWATDGSLEGGFEIITQPMDEKSFFGMDWSKANDYLRDNGWRSHDTSTCGLHFHFSVGYLGYNSDQIRDSAKKLCHFFEMYWGELKKFSRRSDFGYCGRYNREIDQSTDFYDLKSEGRYKAVNLDNIFKDGKNTIEIRICRGSLNTNTQMASADFLLHLVRNAKNVPWKDIDNLDLWFKGIKNKNTIDYLKSRNCFEGAF